MNFVKHTRWNPVSVNLIEQYEHYGKVDVRFVAVWTVKVHFGW